MAKIQGVHVPLQPRNLAINGALDFWQRVEGTTTSVTNTAVSNYTADMVVTNVQGSTSKVYTVARSTNVPSLAQSGFNSTYSLLFTNTTGVPSPAAGDVWQPWNYRMEGLDYEKIHGKTITIGFWVYASVIGTYNLSLQNPAASKSYVTNFSIASANTWTFVPITLTLDNSASGWNFDNTTGLYITIGGYAGTTGQTATTNAWTAGTFYAATGSTNWLATSGAIFQIAQFSIVEGPLGFGATGFARQGSDIQQELALCQRYFQKSYNQGVVPGTATAVGATAQWASGIAGSSGGTTGGTIFLKTEMRTAPTMTGYETLSGTINLCNPYVASGARSGTATFTTANGNFSQIGTSGCSVNFVSSTSFAGFIAQWTADAGL